MPKKDFNATKEATALAKSLFDGDYVVHDNDIPKIAEALQAAYDAGRTDLNGRDMIDTLDAGEVEFLSDHAGKVWLNVDGRCLFRAGKTESVKVDLTRVTVDAPGVPDKYADDVTSAEAGAGVVARDGE